MLNWLLNNCSNNLQKNCSNNFPRLPTRYSHSCWVLWEWSESETVATTLSSVRDRLSRSQGCALSGLASAAVSWERFLRRANDDELAATACIASVSSLESSSPTPPTFCVGESSRYHDSPPYCSLYKSSAC